MSGKLVPIDGKSGATPGAATGAPLDVVPKDLAGNNAFAKRLSIRHLSGAGDLRLYLNQTTTYITIKPSEAWSGVGLVTTFRVVSSSGTVEWEGVAEV